MSQLQLPQTTSCTAPASSTFFASAQRSMRAVCIAFLP